MIKTSSHQYSFAYLISFFLSVILGLELFFETMFFSIEINILVVLTAIGCFLYHLFWQWRILFVEGHFFKHFLGFIFILAINYYHLVNFYCHFAICHDLVWRQEWWFLAFLWAVLSVVGFLIQCLIYLFLFIKWVIDNRQGHAT